MSKYTTELRFICEESAGLAHSEGYTSIDSVLDKSRDKIFDFDFPIFDENYRIPLENKILKHYYTREIGFETVGLWKHFLGMRMNEIMPYYNKLYSSELIEFNPMYDVDLTTDYNKVNNGDRDKSSEFIENGSFLQEDTTSQHDNSTSETSSTENSNLIEATNSNGNETSNQNKVSAENSTANEAGNFNNTSNKNETNVFENTSSKEETGTKEETSNSSTDMAGASSSAGDNHSHSHGTDNNIITNKNDHWEYFSDTPEGGIAGLTASGAVGDLNYLTTALHTTDNGSGSINNKTLDNTTDGESTTNTSTNDHSETTASKNDTTKNNSGVSNAGSVDKETNVTNNGVESKDSNASKDSEENISGTIDKTSNSETSTSGDKTGNKTTTSEGDVNSNAVKTGSDNKNGSANSSEVIKNIEDYLHHVVGKSGGVSYSKLLNEYRDTFLNIDMMIIKDLKDLFMNVW